MENRLNILSESLDQKLLVLREIMAYNEKQEQAFRSEAVDLESFDEAVEEKGRLIEKLSRLDDGFETLYAQLSEELKQNRQQYAEQIKELQTKVAEVTIDDFTKTVGYACLYKSLAEKTDEIPLSEITISLIRERYPKRLMKAMADNGYTISEYCPGIYYVTGNLLFATQIIVTNYLGREHQWLRVLSAHAKEEDIISFAYASTNLTTQGEHNNADAIYQVSVMANYEMYEELKRRKPLMCEALKLLMKNELDESMEKGMEKGIEQGRLDEIISSVLDGDYSKERGAEKLGIPIQEFDELLGRFPKNPA